MIIQQKKQKITGGKVGRIFSATGEDLKDKQFHDLLMDFNSEAEQLALHNLVNFCSLLN